jgi:hypothetical protein
MIEEPLGAPYHQLFGQARQVRGRDRRIRQEFQGEVPIRYGIQGIGHGLIEAERLGGRPPVDGKRGAGQGGGAQRALVEPCPGIVQPAAVAPEHLHIGQQMMAEGYRLRRLEVGETGH